MRRQRRIAAKPVTYGGIEFRSTLEGRWAVFFDAAGIEWRYEPKWFQLPSGPYLPDFWLPDLYLWVEVKPVFSMAAFRRLAEIHDHVSGEYGMLLTAEDLRIPDGPGPDFDNYDGPHLCLYDRRGGDPVPDRTYLFSECPNCQAITIAETGQVCHCAICDYHDEANDDVNYNMPLTFNTTKLRGAFQRAQRYRF